MIEKTGKPIAHWMKVLAKFKAETKKSNESVGHLQDDHGVPRYWARTLTTRYLKEHEAKWGLVVRRFGGMLGSSSQNMRWIE